MAANLKDLPFQNVEAEQQLLGAILTDNRLFDRVGDFLRPEFFADPLHGRIFELCRTRIARGHLVSPVVLKSLMGEDEGLKQLGGPAYLARLAAGAVASSGIRDYARIIMDDACRRTLATACEDGQLALAQGGEPSEVALALQQAVLALPESAGSESSWSLMRAMSSAVDRAVAAYRGEVSYLKTGLPALDRLIKGLAPGDVCLLGGATSMGKTALALSIAESVALDRREKVLFASLEMGPDDLSARLAAAKARVPYESLRDPQAMEEASFKKWVEAAQAISDAPLHITPRHVRDSAAIFSAARRAGNVGLVVVDYMQLMRAKGRDTREQMRNASIETKAMAGLLEAPVLALVQISRRVGEREDARPQLSDISETSQFEKDADQVIFAHREAYWMERKGPQADRSGNISDGARIEWEADLNAVKNRMQIIVRKNRHGRLGTAEVGFHAPTNRFWDLSEGDDEC